MVKSKGIGNPYAPLIARWAVVAQTTVDPGERAEAARQVEHYTEMAKLYAAFVAGNLFVPGMGLRWVRA